MATKITRLGDHYYVELQPNYFLCIGSAEEVDQASEDRIIEMVLESLAYRDFRNIESAKQRTLH